MEDLKFIKRLCDHFDKLQPGDLIAHLPRWHEESFGLVLSREKEFNSAVLRVMMNGKVEVILEQEVFRNSNEWYLMDDKTK